MNFKKLMKNKKFLWGSAGIITALLIYWYFRHEADSKVLEYTGTSEKWTIAAQDPNNLDGNKILKSGSRGVEVAALQMALKAEGQELGTYGPNKDGIDGVFGPATEKALMNVRGVKEITLNQFNATVSERVIAELKETATIYN